MISRAILATLTYSDHFGFPLTLSELHSRLIRVKVSRTQLVRSLTNFPPTRGYYHLPGRSSLVSRRLARARHSAPLLSRARSVSAHLPRVPGVLAIYLTGSLAVSNSGPKSDIDLMVITHPGRLWTTRLFLTLYTTIRGWRRRAPNVAHRAKWGHPQSVAGKICLNLYLTPDSFTLPSSRQNLYTAYELIQATPLYDPHNTHSTLLSANSWLSNYLPNFVLPPLPTRRYDFMTLQLYDQIIEQLAYLLQRQYMKNKITRELITPDSAFFHPRDPGRPILRHLRLLK